MDYKYYTVIPFATKDEAVAFSQSYHQSPTEDGQNTRYRYPVTQTEDGTFSVVVYDLNELSETDIVKVTIQKVNTDFTLLH